MIDDHDTLEMKCFTDLPIAVGIATLSKHQQLFNQVRLFIEHQYIIQEKLRKEKTSLNWEDGVHSYDPFDDTNKVSLIRKTTLMIKNALN
jgi:hypothetical protein